jgi:hypothetical protein
MKTNPTVSSTSNLGYILLDFAILKTLTTVFSSLTFIIRSYGFGFSLITAEELC